MDRGFQILDERRDGGAEILEEEEESGDKRRACRREEDGSACGKATTVTAEAQTSTAAIDTAILECPQLLQQIR